MSRVVHFFLIIYVASLPVSIAVMEISSTLLAILGLGHILYTIGVKRERPQLALGLDLWLWLFWAIMIIGALLIPTLTLGDRIYIFGEGRWILNLYSLTYLLRTFPISMGRWLPWVWAWFTVCSITAIAQVKTGVVAITGKVVGPHDIGGGLIFYRIIGFLGNPMTYSHTMGLWFCLFLALLFLGWRHLPKWGKVLGIFNQTLLGLSLVLSFTRGVWLSVLVASFTMFFLVGRKWALRFSVTAIVLLLAGMTVFPSVRNRVTTLGDQSNMGRIQIWKANWAMYLDHPLLGVGHRQNSKHVQDYYNKLGIESDLISHAHNNFLQMLGGLGSFGLLAFLVFNGLLIMRSYRLYTNHREGDWRLAAIGLGVFGAYIHLQVGGLTESNFHDGEVNHSFVFLSALMLSCHTSSS